MRLALTTFMACLPVVAMAQSAPPSAKFSLQANPAFVACLAADGSTPPTAAVLVKRGDLNDSLEIVVTGLKPNLQFDLFTVQHTPFLADGSADPDFKKTFGLAWYQSDLNADNNGVAVLTLFKRSSLRSIFLDQIFGFDGDLQSDGATPILPPTNTYHVGFWFNNPQDAAPCGFDVTKPTPFNGQHQAGPLAMISLPVAPANFGPLCTVPQDADASGNCDAP